MKLDRLLSIVILLANRKIVQAKELSELFEVSVRTIYRDIDAINQAGIPVVSYQGAGGGIGLSEGYRLDRSVLTEAELADIVNALQSVSTIYPDRDRKLLLEKMKSVVPAAEAERFQFRTRQLVVDLSPWGGSGHLEEKVALLKKAAEEERLVEFAYCDAQGNESARDVEPYTLVLKRQSWYLYGYCRGRRQFRLFKLFRMKGLTIGERFDIRRPVELERLPWNEAWHAPGKTTRLKLRFSRRARHLAEEWFGVEAVVAEAAGEGGEERYVVAAELPEDRWLYGFILSFGPDAEVLEPESIREEIRRQAQGIIGHYAAKT